MTLANVSSMRRDLAIEISVVSSLLGQPSDVIVELELVRVQAQPPTVLEKPPPTCADCCQRWLLLGAIGHQRADFLRTAAPGEVTQSRTVDHPRRIQL